MWTVRAFCRLGSGSVAATLVADNPKLSLGLSATKVEFVGDKG